MAAIRVKAKLWVAPIKAFETVERVAEQLRADGWGLVPYGCGDTVGVVPRTIAIWFDLQKLGGTREMAELAVKRATGGGFFSSWSDFSSAFKEEVISKSASDAADLAKRAGAAVEKASWGIGFGFGTVAGVVALGAGGFLAWKYLR